jgi:hypothetical protein
LSFQDAGRSFSLTAVFGTGTIAAEARDLQATCSFGIANWTEPLNEIVAIASRFGFVDGPS